VCHLSLDEGCRRSVLDISYSWRFATLAKHKNRRAAVPAAMACERRRHYEIIGTGVQSRDGCRAIYRQLNCKKGYAVGHGLLEVSQRRLVVCHLRFWTMWCA
jgi:hypothetical protein